MSLIGEIIGGATGVVGSIFGGINASKAMRKVKDNLEKQRLDNRAWYERRYNEDATQRADAQAILTRTEEAIRARNRAAEGAQAVAGGTEESVAAEKAANTRALAEAATTIAVNGERRKDILDESYQERDARLQGSLNDMEAGRAREISKAVSGVASAAGNMADAF